jgi:hypothetical protein
MDASLLEELIAKNKPFKIRTLVRGATSRFCELFDQENFVDYLLRREWRRAFRDRSTSHNHSCNGAGLNMSAPI